MTDGPVKMISSRPLFPCLRPPGARKALKLVPPETPHHRARLGDPALARALERRVEGDVRFDARSRALYATDASIYEVEPIGVVIPRSTDDVSATLDLARTEGIPVLPRGGGTSQCGQAVGRAIVMDTSRYLNRVIEVDPEARTVTVEPGIVLDHLNDLLSPTGLMFPVDVATANRATIGGMAGNNSGGARSIRYGIMADNVVEIDAELGDGRIVRFGPDRSLGGQRRALARRIQDLVSTHRGELEARVPKVLRHVAGYNLHRLLDPGASMAELLVGSEGTLAYFRSLTLGLAETPLFRVLGVCRFQGLVPAMAAVQHIVTLDPHAVELVDENLLRLARTNEAFRPTVEQFMSGASGAVLLVEFAGDDPAALTERLRRLGELVGDIDPTAETSPAPSPEDQARIWALRKASLSIAMSMKGDRKPVSFIEDCAVPLPRLAEYATELEAIFARHDTSSIWYAHASVGCLHVRPALSMKDPADVRRMRSIAEQVHDVVRRLGGSHSGEHGDGILRSEFIRTNLGAELEEAFRQLKAACDPAGLLNPGRIVDAPDMDDRTLFRFGPEYHPKSLPTVMDWGDWGGFSGAVEMCNNNGACRKHRAGVMCPSYRATRDEADTTRGRANVLRRALNGGFGPLGELAPEVHAALDLCVGCKACKTECPTGVDMARMKAEVAHRAVKAHGATPRQTILGHLPSAARWASRFPALSNGAGGLMPVRRLGERLLGISAGRPLPRWHPSPFKDAELPRWTGPSRGDGVIVFADTFHRYFDPEVIRAGRRAIEALSGARVWSPPSRGRPICCGRTYISNGFLERGRLELQRTVAALAPAAEAGLPILGFEPSCIGTLRDELADLVPGPAARVVSQAAAMAVEFLAAREDLPDSLAGQSAWVHAHCHEKALGDPDATARLLRGLGARVTAIESSCCGMAGSFGYEAEHEDVSMAMGEISLFPAVRRTTESDVIVANGFSCRAQIRDGTGRKAHHVLRLIPPHADP